MKDRNLVTNSIFRIVDSSLTALHRLDLITLKTREKIETILQEEIKWEK